jgi:hypothetical protein
MTTINFDDMTHMEQWIVLMAIRTAGPIPPVLEDCAHFSLQIWGSEVDFTAFVSNLAKELIQAHEESVTRDREQFASEHRVLTEGFAELRRVMGNIDCAMHEVEEGVGHSPAVIHADSLMFVVESRGERTPFTGFKEAWAMYEKLKDAKRSVRIYVQQTIPGAPVIESLVIGHE